MSGVLDFAVSFPRGRADVHEMHAASGVPLADILAITHAEGFPVLGEGETAWELAARAAAELLERTPVAREEIRYVIYAGSGQWDRPFWSPAAKVAHHLGIERAHCFEVANFCNAGMAALKVATDRLDSAPAESGGYALVLVGDRLSRMVDYTDPASKALFNFGDAAAAMLVARGHAPFRLLHTAMRTDPSWSDYYAGELRDGKVAIRRAAHRTGLAAAYVENFTALIGETLDAIGAKPGDIDHLLINQGDRDMHRRLLAELGLPADKSVFNYHRLGHMGGADTLIALDGLREQHRLRGGELILLATSAMGFSWGITALEYHR
ncbi:3-oxoacyl-ACP synthase III family protein [Kitasatospora sp. DSM 101779]|uniref:3-oxoacyl-ACP synthase III family protein n=1 Tax=Kitasatospora sp. DSM 101779 TaxID=2853165 RepID=UPI0021DB3DD5|nr:3-oxoacyl-[acyl-carrier-protein] synthase III C-terminal domain-containing protein [Kitasatospora sp. DSM 101779]MCU7822170.1 3-oxoacyl-ACP synthase [Kitasatospora sp. DSM 101779]